uniref:Uncharacterized protein n=1 Tax=Parascaris equorum TaxID=6256 RepID=A0A914R1H7_PAREQ
MVDKFLVVLDKLAFLWQKILEDYKRKKMERELEANSGFQNGRGHSQPPTPSRPKSTVRFVAHD